MKFLTLFALFLSTTSAFAHEICNYRFNPGLAVTVVVNDRMGENRFGSISWDNMNVCTSDGLCTEIYPGSFKVRFKDLTDPNEEGAINFKVKSINSRDDNGNSYNRNSQFGRFIRNARFESAVNPEPQLWFFWKGKSYKMKCYSTDNEEN